MKRTPLKRHTALSRARRGARRVTAEEQASRAAWHLEAQRRGCEVRDGHECVGPVQGHHVVGKRTLRKWRTMIEAALPFLSPARTFADVLWDTRNLMGVCEHRHEQHTGAYARIHADHLTDAHREFAAELMAMGFTNLHTEYRT